jgi:hypothetical protein
MAKYEILSILLVSAAFLHVIEEYYGGFIKFVNTIVPGVMSSQFVFINALFIIYVIIALASNSLLLALSVPFLLIINAAIHIFSTIIFRKYGPGVVTAVVLYLPLSCYFIRQLNPGREIVLRSALLAAALMAIPLVFQAARLVVNRISQPKAEAWKRP